MPNDEFVSPDEVYSSSGEHSKKVRLRGTFEWAPPRKQWIFNLHPAQIKYEIVRVDVFISLSCMSIFEQFALIR
jgi:hypothetical protein